MERTFPAYPNQNIIRPRWRTDLLFYLGQNLFWSWLVLWILGQFGTWLQALVPISFQRTIQEQNYFLQVTEVVILSDLLIYWAHRWQHSWSFLWRFHKTHHTAEHLDWLAAYREHPLDTVFTVGVINLPAFCLGFPLETLAGFIAFRGLWAVYIHSNVSLPIGPLKWVIGSPELHHWHHVKERNCGNYANLSPLMDLLFGTHVAPGHFPDELGVNGEGPKSYWYYLIEPFLPKRK
ncbi:MAG: sterol desaturase family protein [Bacteroidetes bacterium]|nr:MAG: sterol desaturase family protein [Bacteroidota bacterium]